MSYTIEGTIHHIGETQTFGSKGFRKRDCVIKTQEQYPQLIPVEFVQDKCELLDPYQPGDGVKVNINMRGREWTSPQGETKYFLSLQAWRIDDFGASESASAQSQSQPSGSGNGYSDTGDYDDPPF